MTEARRVDALQLIFSVFLGILTVVVIGVGVWTFYPQPGGPNSADGERLEELYQEQERINMRTGGKVMTPGDQQRVAEIQDEIDEINDRNDDLRDQWAVNTSIILLSFATVLMAISLFLPDTMRVFSNGILLGGLFTVIYGTGWSFAGGDSRARFFVVLAALVLSVLFGYLRFVRGRRVRTVAAVGAGAGAEGTAMVELGALEERVRALEARAEAAAEALAGHRER